MTTRAKQGDVQDRAIKAAIEIRQRAYAPYSKFPVGAALVTSDGEIFTGCNVENASYGLTICAERVAVFSAVAAGQRQFDLLVIATEGGYAPCGACRQVLAEFATALPIVLVDTKHPSQVAQHNLKTLLPHTFRLAADE
jgi:cytidine deaminase